MKLGIVLVVIFGINIIYSVFYGGAHIGLYLFYTAMLTWGVIRIIQAVKKQSMSRKE